MFTVGDVGRNVVRPGINQENSILILGFYQLFPLLTRPDDLINFQYNKIFND